MLLLKFVLKNAFRHRLRAVLTICGVAVALLAFGLLRTVLDAWNAGVAASSANRLVTRNAISMNTVNDFILLLLSWINALYFPRSRRRFFELGYARELFAALPGLPAIEALAERYHARHAPAASGT